MTSSLRRNWLDADFYEQQAKTLRLGARPFEERVLDLSVADEEGRVRAFRWRNVQKVYWQRRNAARRRIVLKARRHGISTIELLRAYDRLKFHPNQRQVFLADTYENTINIFSNAETYFDTDPNPPRLRGGKPSRSAFRATNGSSLYIGTAGARTFGRGTTLQSVHASEVAFWTGKPQRLQSLLAGLSEAASHGDLTLESTANGFDALFRPIWIEAEKRGFLRVFLPWFINPAYSDQVHDVRGFLERLTKDERALAEKYCLDAGQIAWRRRKKAELGVLFPQEYPAEPEEAFIASGSGLYTAHDSGAQLQEAITAAPRPLREIGSFAVGGEQWFVAGPAQNVAYLITADSAEGHADGDFSAFVVRDEFGKLVGCGQYRMAPHAFGVFLVDLARRWNEALIVPESNSIGAATIVAITETSGYRRVYRERKWNGSNWVESANYGWRTTETTRSIAIQEHLRAFLAGELDAPSTWILGQMVTIARAQNGRWEGIEHDDLWMADIISLMAIRFGLVKRKREGVGDFGSLFGV